MSVKRYQMQESAFGPFVPYKDFFKLENDYATLLASHNTLVEAVAWERECCQDIRPLVAWAGLYVRHGEDYVDGVAEDLRAIQADARAEVDRLIATADCKGEGCQESPE